MNDLIINKAIGKPAGTILDRLDMAGVTFTVETVPHGWPTIRRNGITVADTGTTFTTLADELYRSPTVVRRWVTAAPLAERFRRCGIDVPDWMEHETERPAGRNEI
ncbi:hypothetical protein BW14_06100 [Bifidobacterium sp. UTBIF-68]|uniref:hypothetical protein n=1 Tax=Bifidobacterium sp. UTBIF-68 TaxID=1465262 RepID=UPI0011273C0D|nr:hypothetical protein [Bifidobacterium sp. UTBIF-68]TPF93246.1 hypothetical protein BW14_06100 [Bifidobacterium sp. UTBIF-68]